MTNFGRLMMASILLWAALVFLPCGVVAQNADETDVESEEEVQLDDEETVQVDGEEEIELSDEANGVSEEEVELTDEEVAELLTRVDRFFADQDMYNLTVDVDIYRDPSRRLDEQNIRSGDPSRIAGLSTIVGHFRYEYPEFYELKIMGQVLAGSEVPEDQTFFSQLLPMPGAPIFTEDLRERFCIRFDGMGEVEGREAYMIRYSALDRDNEFFDYIVYYIDTEYEVILRVESAFDNVWYAGVGRGNYYYDEWLGKYLPVYGHGTVLFYPNRSHNVWGRWYRWDWQSAEALEEEMEQTDEGGDIEETESAEEPVGESE